MKSSFSTALALAGLLGLVGGAVAQAQNLVVNGDFNSSGVLSFTDGSAALHVTPADDAYDFGTGWFSQRSGAVFNQSGARSITTSDGGGFVTLESVFYTNSYGGTQRSDGSINQYVSLRAGTTYSLSFDAQLVERTVALDAIFLGFTLFADAGGTIVQPFRDAGYATGGGVLRVYFDKTGTWGNYEYTFTASADADYYFGIQMSGLGNSLVLVNTGVIALDNVSITAVPEPSAFATFAGVGALGCAALRRRRRAA